MAATMTPRARAPGDLTPEGARLARWSSVKPGDVVISPTFGVRPVTRTRHMPNGTVWLWYRSLTTAERGSATSLIPVVSRKVRTYQVWPEGHRPVEFDAIGDADALCKACTYGKVTRLIDVTDGEPPREVA